MNQHNEPITPFNLILRRRRQELNLHLADIAQALDVTPEAISMWERGRRRMNLDKLPTIAQVLQLQESDFCQPHCATGVFQKWIVL